MDDRAPVIVSPFANERIREWPMGHFRRLIGLMLDRGDGVAVVGTRSQRVRANYIVRGFSSLRVTNACGVMDWHALADAVDTAPYVIANNSGVAHLAAERGRWTLCLFAGSHSLVEWMPRGRRVVTISRAIACSPCELGGMACPNGMACMRGLEPEEALTRFWAILENGSG